jgi:glutamate carboxypeptidase
VIDPDLLQSHLTRRLPTAMDALRQMVGINSFTHNAAGVDRVGDLTEALFEPLGLVAERSQAIECTSFERPPLGHHLFLSGSATNGLRIGMVGHLDTVFTQTDETAHDFRWREAGDRIYGPGTVDMKGGNVLIWMVLDAIRELSPRSFDRVDWRVMFNAAEEGLASQFPSLARSKLGPDARACLVYEGGELHEGTHHLINRRKGSVGLRAIARGRAAHAGGRHERGANAIVQLSELILRMHAMTDYSNDLTCNVGIVRGGSVVNQVPDLAEALIEMRAYEPAILDAACERAMELDGLSTVSSAADGFKASIEMSCRLRHAPWPVNPGTESLLRVAQAWGRQLGFSVEGRGRGGLSDGNFLWDIAPTLDGLGPVGANLHCAVRSADGSADQEYVLPGSFVPKAMLSVRIIEQLLQQA